MVTCPDCDSPSVDSVLNSDVSFGRSVIAGAFAGAGSRLVPSRVEYEWVNRCVSCGAQWQAGSEDERHRRRLSGQFGDTSRQLALAQERARKAKALRDVLIYSGVLFASLGLLFGMCFAAQQP